MSVVRSIQQTYLFCGLWYETKFHKELRVIHRPREQTRVRGLGEGSVGSFGLADASCYNRVDKEQSPVAWHRQLYPSSWGKAQWKRTQKRMYIHAQPNQLAVQQESTEHLYINCSSI